MDMVNNVSFRYFIFLGCYSKLFEESKKPAGSFWKKVWLFKGTVDIISSGSGPIKSGMSDALRQ